jgi:nitrate reductase delta subunit
MTAVRCGAAAWRQAELLALSGLLGYPDDRWHARWPARRRVLVRRRLDRAAALVPLAGLTPSQRRQMYVATFDFDGEAALYLTAHEAGDERRRGELLHELQVALDAAGFLPPPTELPDYIPALLEFVALAPRQRAALGARVGCALARIAAHLPLDHPYRPLAEWGAAWLAPAPAIESLRPRDDPERPEDVPYPADPLAFSS